MWKGQRQTGAILSVHWLEQMAASYDPQVYTALINLEHIKGYTLIAHSAVSGPWISWRQRRLQTAR